MGLHLICNFFCSLLNEAMNEESYLRKLCSNVTLQSQKEGFFHQWAEQVESALPKEFWTKFEDLNTDLKRIKTLWNEKVKAIKFII